MASNSNSWINISESAFNQNISFLKRKSLNEKICLNLKADAYGYGLLNIASICKKEKSVYLGVHSLNEAIFLRNNNIKNNIYVLGFIEEKLAEEIIKYDLETVLYDSKLLESLKKAAKKYKSKAKIHLKIETGLNRQGLNEIEVKNIIPQIDSNLIELKYITSHFADIEDGDNLFFAKEQVKKLEDVYNYLKISFPNLKRHIGNSASLINNPEFNYDMTRPGISIYGLWPSKNSRQIYLKNNSIDPLKPIGSWQSKIAQIKKISKGQTVGYSRSFLAEKDCTIAVIPVGYYEGLSRNYNLGQYGVLINNIFCPFVGRICMNNSMVKIDNRLHGSDMEIATLIEDSYESLISAEKVALATNRINYQVFTDIKNTSLGLVPRVLIK